MAFLLDLRRPTPPLDRFVESITYFEGYCPDHSREKLLPDGGVEIVIDLDGSPKHLFDRDDPRRARSFREAWVSGMRREYIVIEAAQQSSMAVIRFRPGGAHPFLGLPLAELTDVVEGLDAVLGVRADSLREQVLEAPTPAAKHAAIEAWLLELAADRLEPCPVVEFLVERLADPRDARITELVGRIGYSHKHAIALFKKQVGLTPKQYCRIRKFQQVVQLLEGRQDVDWADVAWRCGYYDQAHFINEFRRFSGMNPTTYLDSRGEYLNYIPLDPR